MDKQDALDLLDQESELNCLQVDIASVEGLGGGWLIRFSSEGIPFDDENSRTRAAVSLGVHARLHTCAIRDAVPVEGGRAAFAVKHGVDEQSDSHPPATRGLLWIGSDEAQAPMGALDAEWDSAIADAAVETLRAAGTMIARLNPRFEHPGLLTSVAAINRKLA